MGKKKDSLIAYNFVGMDGENITNNNYEIMMQLYCDKLIAPPVDEKWNSLTKNTARSKRKGGVHGKESKFEKAVSSVKARVYKFIRDNYCAEKEIPLPEEQAMINIRMACEDSKRMSVRDFVLKHHPHAEHSLLLGIQSAKTILGDTDIDWAITLAHFNLYLFWTSGIPSGILYAGGKPLWNLSREEELLYNFWSEEEVRAIVMSDQMVYLKVKFHEFFPQYS